MDEKVFCAPGMLGIIDMAVEREDGVLVGQISKETIEQLGARYPGVMVDTMGEAIARRNTAMTHSPTEITEQQFFSALECLPPMGWVNNGNTESFKMSEFTAGAITGIYARIDARYFTLSDVYSMKHEDIIAKVESAMLQLDEAKQIPKENESPVPSLDESIQCIKSEILADINTAKVSPDVKSFSDLHDFVDANEYGGFCDDDFLSKLWGFHGAMSDDGCPAEVYEYTHNAQNAISMWIANGGIREAFDLSMVDAEKIAGEKAAVEFANPNGTKVFDGKIMAVTGMHIVMSLGREAVICEQRFLDRVPAKGEEVVITFVGGGLAEVSAVIKKLDCDVER